MKMLNFPLFFATIRYIQLPIIEIILNEKKEEAHWNLGDILISC